MLSRLKRLPLRAFDELRKECIHALPAIRPRRILFDHIPKCAGTTLSAYLQGHFPRRLIFSMNGRQPMASVENFRRLPASKRHRYALIKGHLAGHLFDDIHPNCLRITILREPVDRIVSHYFYARRTPAHYLYEKIAREGLSLRDYIEKDVSHELRNHYTLHFSGLSREEAERNPEAALAKALERLRRYDLVGFQDDLPAFIEQLRHTANLRLPFPEKKVNVTKDRRSVAEIDEATRVAVEEANALDVRFYQMVSSHDQGGLTS